MNNLKQLVSILTMLIASAAATNAIAGTSTGEQKIEKIQAWTTGAYVALKSHTSVPNTTGCTNTAWLYLPKDHANYSSVFATLTAALNTESTVEIYMENAGICDGNYRAVVGVDAHYD